MLESDEEKHLFKELYERYGNAMLRVAQRYFPSDLTAAEDAVQNAWLKVIKNFSKIQEDSSNMFTLTWCADGSEPNGSRCCCELDAEVV